MFTENGFKFLQACRAKKDDGSCVELSYPARILLAHVYSRMEVEQNSVHEPVIGLEGMYAISQKTMRTSAVYLRKAGVLDYGSVDGKPNTGSTFTKISNLHLFNLKDYQYYLTGMEFTQETIIPCRDVVESQTHEYYVYLARVDGEPSYVGKGKKSRVDHCHSGASHCRKLNEDVITGKTVTTEILFSDLTEAQAFQTEKDTIVTLTKLGHNLYNSQR